MVKVITSMHFEPEHQFRLKGGPPLAQEVKGQSNCVAHEAKTWNITAASLHALSENMTAEFGFERGQNLSICACATGMVCFLEYSQYVNGGQMLIVVSPWCISH